MSKQEFLGRLNEPDIAGWVWSVFDGDVEAWQRRISTANDPGFWPKVSFEVFGIVSSEHPLSERMQPGSDDWQVLVSYVAGGWMTAQAKLV
jgi:hypothetical protein